MKRLFWTSIAILLIIASCGSGESRQTEEKDTKAQVLENPNEQEFLNRFCDLKGKSYHGEVSYVVEGRESYEGEPIVMHVTVCEPKKVHFPIHIGNDFSRTWQLLVEDGKLRLRHDHQHPDGTEEDLNMYGGFADGTGNALEQYFLADQYTKDLTGDEFHRQWKLSFTDDMRHFVYQLEYDREVIIQFTFNLENPV